MAQTTKIYSFINNALLFIEHYWKIILVGIIILVTILKIESCAAKKRILKDLHTVKKYEDTSYTSEIKKWKDAYNAEHVRAEDLTVDEIEMSFAMDSITKLLNLKSGRIVAVSKASAKIVIKEVPVIIDSVFITEPCPDGKIEVVKSRSFKWSNGHTTVSGIIGADSNVVNISGTDTLNRVEYFNKKHWYSKKIWYTDLNHTNPDIQTTGYKGLQMVRPQKLWSIGVGLQVGYPVNNVNFRKPVIQLGIGIQRTLISF